ncbi:MAG: hypothetical protein AAF846_16085 [Chloroflexota bacterium]
MASQELGFIVQVIAYWLGVVCLNHECSSFRVRDDIPLVQTLLGLHGIAF